MAKQKYDQETQVGKSDVYDDTLPPGATLETAVENLRGDLNALRSQLRRFACGEDPSGDWKVDVVTAFGGDASLQALYNSGLAFDEDKISVSRDGTIVVNKDGNVVRGR